MNNVKSNKSLLRERQEILSEKLEGTDKKIY